MNPLIIAAVVAALSIIAFVVLRSKRSSKPAAPVAVAQSTTTSSVRDSTTPDAVDPSLTPLTIYYGSQTGTAEGFAKTIADQSRRHGFLGVAKELDKFSTWGPAELMKGGKVIFIVATYGEGEPTDNANQFYKWITGTPGSDPAAPPTDRALENLQFTVFGVGDSTYEHYNKMGKVTNARLEALGGKRIYRHGEGNASGNLEEDFDSWREGLWTALRGEEEDAANSGGRSRSSTGGSSIHGGGDDDDGVPDLPALEWRAVPVAPPSASMEWPMMTPSEAAQLASSAGISSRHFFQAVDAVIRTNNELRSRPDVGFSTRHIDIDLVSGPGNGVTIDNGAGASPGAGVGLSSSYRTADNLKILPENDPATVSQVARWLGLNLDDWYSLEPAPGATSPRPSIPSPFSVRHLLTRCIDLHGPPRKALLGHLSHFAGLAEEREALLRLTRRSGKDEYAAWVTNAQRSIYEVFQTYQSLRLSVENIVNVMPRLAPRAYTIASSSLVQPSVATVVASVLDAPKEGGGSRRLKGVCSNYLASLRPGAKVKVVVTPSTFHLPADASRPVILVGPGTGIAPMRAFLQERRFLRSQGVNVGPTILFFGCQRSDADYIYKDELTGYVADGTLTGFYTAFSREGASKVYVQHLLAQQGANVWNLISNQRGSVYVCGATKMGQDVMRTFMEIAEREGEMPTLVAEQTIKAMQTEGRYVQELWSS